MAYWNIEILEQVVGVLTWANLTGDTSFFEIGNLIPI